MQIASLFSNPSTRFSFQRTRITSLALWTCRYEHDNEEEKDNGDDDDNDNEDDDDDNKDGGKDLAFSPEHGEKHPSEAIRSMIYDNDNDEEDGGKDEASSSEHGGKHPSEAIQTMT